MSDYAAWTREVLTLLHVEKPHVIAHSFGSRVAVKMSALYGEVFDKILLTGPAGIISKRGLGYRLKVKTYRLAKKFAPKYAEKNFGSKEYRNLSPIMKESYKKIVNEDLRIDATSIKNPVLIVEGVDDKTTPLSEAQIYMQSLQNGRLQTMQGDHFAFAEHPLPFNLIAEEFLYD